MAGKQPDAQGTVATEIRNRVMAAYDQRLSDAIHREMCYTYGADQESSRGMQGSWGIKLYPDVSASTMEIGKVRKSMKGATAFVSRLMGAEVVPSFNGISEIEKQIREAYWLARYRGEGQPGSGLMVPIRDTWTNGWMHGFGALHKGFMTDPKSQRQRLIATASDPRYTIYDDLARDPRDADWVCIFDLYPVYEAKQLFDADLVEQRKVQLQQFGQNNTARYAVVVGHYYDVGLGGEMPLMARFLGGPETNPALVREMPFETLPCSWMVNTLLPGMRRPIGQVAMMQAAEEAVNLLIALIKEMARRNQGYFAIDPQKFKPEALEAMRQGRFDTVLELTGDWEGATPPVMHVKGPGVDQATITVLQFMVQELNEQLGLSEIGRGGTVEKDATKYELASMQQNMAANAAGPAFSTRVFLRDTIKQAYAMARDYDRHPFMATIMGHQIEFNNPAEPSSSLAHILEAPAEIHISEDSLQTGGDMLAMQQSISKLKEIAPFLGRGIDVKEFLRRLTDALRLPDPDSLMMGGEAQGTPDTAAN